MNNFERTEATDIIGRIAKLIMVTLPIVTGRPAAETRRVVGALINDAPQIVESGTVAASMLAAINSARLAGADAGALGRLRLSALAETPTMNAGQSVVRITLLLCLAQEARIIAATTYTSRQDVDTVSAAVAIAYAAVEELFADWTDPSIYLVLLRLHSDLVRHLADAARPLPMMIPYSYIVSMPSVTMSNRIYGVADRAEQLVAENKVVHPAFMPRDGVALSN